MLNIVFIFSNFYTPQYLGEIFHFLLNFVAQK